LDPEDPWAFPFWLAGCTIEEDFTFRLAGGTNLNVFWAELDSKTCNLIRAASKKLEVVSTANMDDLIELSEREQRGLKNRHNFEALRRIGNASLERDQSTLMVARNDAGSPVAASMLVWDEEVLFYWQSARDPESALPGANSLLAWRSIQFAMERGLTFDFDGYHSRSAATFAMTLPSESVSHKWLSFVVVVAVEKLESVFCFPAFP
jgi:hypothetical protein